MFFFTVLDAALSNLTTNKSGQDLAPNFHEENLNYVYAKSLIWSQPVESWGLSNEFVHTEMSRFLQVLFAHLGIKCPCVIIDEIFSFCNWGSQSEK